MRAVRAIVGLVLALSSGAALAFLSLESAGIAVLVLVLVGRRLRRAPGALAKVLILVGLGYLAAIALWTLRDPWIFSGLGTESYAMAQLAIGLGTIVTGVVLLSRTRRPSEASRS